VTGHVVLFVDNFAIQPGNRKEVLAGLRGFVEQGLESNSEFMVASYDGLLRIEQTFTRDVDRLLAAIAELDKLSPLGVARQAERAALMRNGLRTLQTIQGMVGSDTRGTEAARYLRNFSREIDAHADQLRQQTAATYFALSHLVNALAALPGRKELVYISEGLPMRPAEEMYHAVGEVTRQETPDLASEDSQEARDTSLDMQSAALGALSNTAGGRRRSGRGKGSPDDLQALAALANASRVSFYTLKAPGEIGGMPAEVAGEAAALYTPQLRSIRDRNLGDTLRVMASETGGVALVGSDIESLLQRVEADSGRHYSLGYTPKHSGDGQFHRIKVKVRQRGVKIRYRTGYLDKPVEAKLADRASAALLLGRDDNPLGIELADAKARPAANKGAWIVPLWILIPLDRITLAAQGNLHIGDLQIFVAARDVRGDAAPVQGMSLRIEVADLEASRGQSYTAQLNLELREGPQRVAIGLADPAAGTASFVSRDLVVGAN
jgi:VWFA-related protein